MMGEYNLDSLRAPSLEGADLIITKKYPSAWKAGIALVSIDIELEPSSLERLQRCKLLAENR